MLRSAVEAGAVDGFTGKKQLFVDGIPERIHLNFIELLTELIKAK